jgi:hypothetical protein
MVLYLFSDTVLNYQWFGDGYLLGCSVITIALVMEAASTPETSVNFYQTARCYNPEGNHVRTHHRGAPEILPTYQWFFPALNFWSYY